MKKVLSSIVILCGTALLLFAQGQNQQQSSASTLTAVIIGSGSPQYSAERAGPSVLIRYKNQNILVDMGNGTQANLNKIGFNFRQLEGIFFTHHHLDHNEEFIPTFIQTLLGGNKFQVVGPLPTKEYVSAITSVYRKDIDYRLSRRGGSDFSTVKDNFSIRELIGGETFNLGDIKISTVKVNHTIETVAYRFEAGGKSIVISGDLTYSASLSELAKNADILIVDSGVVIRKGGENVRQNPQGNANGNPGQRQNGQNRRAGGQQAKGAGSRAHSTLDEVGKMAKDANVKKLVMNHLPTAAVDEDATKAAIAKIFKGDISFATDLMEVK
jgi:ribonuclease BN (tRNA processing enzyme)